MTLGAPQAEALTFTLNCVLPSSGPCSAGATWGTVSIVDNAIDANMVDITLSLLGSLGFKELSLNFDAGGTGFGLIADNVWSTTNDPGGVGMLPKITGKSKDTYSPNLQAVGPYDGLFDLQQTKSGTTSEGLTGYTFTLGLSVSGSPFNLNPTHFNFRDTLGGTGVFAGLHVQSCGKDPSDTSENLCSPGVSGGDSIRIGATIADDDLGGSAEDIGGAPGPASLLALGVGILGLGLTRSRIRRRMQFR